MRVKLADLAPPAARDSVIFARVQENNKKWLTETAKSLGFKDTATYLDGVLTALREKGSSNGNKKGRSKSV